MRCLPPYLGQIVGDSIRSRGRIQLPSHQYGHVLVASETERRRGVGGSPEILGQRRLVANEHLALTGRVGEAQVIEELFSKKKRCFPLGCRYIETNLLENGIKKSSKTVSRANSNNNKNVFEKELKKKKNRNLRTRMTASRRDSSSLWLYSKPAIARSTKSPTVP